MIKKQGSVSILAVLIFAIFALIGLFLLSRVQRATTAEKAERDSIQSGYLSESLCYLSWDALDRKVLCLALLSNKRVELPRQTFMGSEASEVTLALEQEPENYSTFKLSTKARYRGIETVAQLKGRLVDKAFESERGVIGAESAPTNHWLEAISNDPQHFKRTHTPLVITQDGDRLAYENRRYVLIGKDESKISFSRNNPLRLVVRGKLQMEVPLHMSGLLFLDKNASIEGTVRLNGVLMARSGSQMSDIEVDGLAICEEGTAAKAHFNPREAEEVLSYFPGFIEPNGIYMKKAFTNDPVL